jgi:hypothetical protein
MNCKPDDIAYIVAPAAQECRGRFVKVLRRAGINEILDGQHYQLSNPSVVAWVCEGQIPHYLGGTVNLSVIGDACLRPIRDQPGDDITLTWAPVPGVLVDA